MQVETYEVTEVDADGVHECDQASIALIEELGLEGQEKLLKRHDDGDGVTRCPYRKMTKQERLVYETLCPVKTKLRKFADSAIPLRVLQVAAHATCLFKHMEVWSVANADVKDPVLVGTNDEGYTREYFILARWGDVLEPLAVLAKKAGEAIRKKRIDSLRQIASECQARIAAAEVMSAESLLSKMSEPTLSDYDR